MAAFAEADTCANACTHTDLPHLITDTDIVRVPGLLCRKKCDVHSRYGGQTWVLLRLSERLCATSEAPHAISARSRASPVVLLS